MRRASRRRFGRARLAPIPLTWSGLPGRHTSQWASNIINFGLKDSKGRVLGGYAWIEERYERTISSSEGTIYEGRKLFFVNTRATRDGVTFGAWPRQTPAETLEAAKALAEKKIAETGARYAKAVAKGEGRQFRKAP